MSTFETVKPDAGGSTEVNVGEIDNGIVADVYTGRNGGVILAAQGWKVYRGPDDGPIVRIDPNKTYEEAVNNFIWVTDPPK